MSLRDVPLAVVLAVTALPIAALGGSFVVRPALDISALFPALAFAVSGGAVSAFIGGMAGAVAGTHAIPARRIVIGLSTALVAAPPAFWWIGVARLPTGLGRLSGPLGASAVAGVALAPITLLLVLAATREIPSNMYDAARVALGPVRRFRIVLLPLLRPALSAGFLLTAILLLGESEIPFLFGFRTSMTDVVTTFSQTFDVGATIPVIAPVVVAVLAIALAMVKPLFTVLLPAASGGRGIVRRRSSVWGTTASLALPAVVALSSIGYVRAALSGAAGGRRGVSVDASVLLVSIAEPVFCAFAATTVAVLAAYPVRRSSQAATMAVIGLLLFCVPSAVVGIGWIAVGQALGGVSIAPAVAYVSRTVGLSVLGFLIAYRRLPQSLEEAAQLVPVSPLRRAWSVMLPLTWVSLAASAALTSALVFADRDVASLLLSPGEARLMLTLYLLSANAPSAVVGATALVVFAAGAAVIALAAAGPMVLRVRRHG